MPLSVLTRSTGKQQPQRITSHLPLKLPEGRGKPSPASALVPTPASAPLRSAALPSRTRHRAPPASVRRQWQPRQRPRRCPPRRTALVVLSPSVPLSTLNRKARSLRKLISGDYLPAELPEAAAKKVPKINARSAEEQSAPTSPR